LAEFGDHFDEAVTHASEEATGSIVGIVFSLSLFPIQLAHLSPARPLCVI
jgi:hypothetical protein